MADSSASHIISSSDIDLQADESRYSHDKNCRKCQVVFGKVGIIHAKKHKWQELRSRFCFHGVCDNCSQQVIIHPLTKQPSRICDICMYDLTENRTLGEVLATSQHSHAEVQEVQNEVYRETQQRQRFQHACTDRQKELQTLREEYQKKESEITSVKERCRELKQLIEAKREELENLKHDNSHNRKESFDNKANEYRSANEELKVKIEGLKSENDTLRKTEEKLNSLKAENNRLRQEISGNNQRKACCSIF